MTEDATDLNAIELATELTIAWLGNPNTRSSADDVPAFLGKMHDTVAALLSATTEPEPVEAPTEYTPAVSVRKSLASKDHIISMIDGKSYKTLRRHLATHGMTPAEYRERYGLKPDYPMVAENYSESRRAMAKKIGLGRKPGARKTDGPAATAAAAPAATTRKRKTETAAA
ncbi:MULTISPECIES: MucR family transcriptional regulator [unclassified Sphingomonas]|uniref:MucR family transcriptional regulator n=1 Tax=unclassified Sphingomonas TaxID=196159 RepID=UPI0006FF2AC5|nr:MULTISPECIES: MucR family transcriptional regulator [unclassified Sphingomonas]KQN24619.1 transcriptional regulator [Sphingomonas sp. Leaf34]KQN27950.1 transcriptional regulator [Sphingomonas sp. Leaf38]